MRPTRFHTEDIANYLKLHKIASIDELKEALGTEVDSTVFRKLKELSCVTSYSHRGAYHTMAKTPHFDANGLWSFRCVWFSRHGTLLATVETLVDKSKAGYNVSELEDIVNVAVKVPLLKLVNVQRLERKKSLGHYLYLSKHGPTRKKQLAARKIFEAKASTLRVGPGLCVMPNELKAAIVLFWSLLDEKQRRLYAGLESMKFGHGGDRQIADLLGIDPGTVARGRKDLLSCEVETDRTRHFGGGRKAVKKKRRTSSLESKKL